MSIGTFFKIWFMIALVVMIVVKVLPALTPLLIGAGAAFMGMLILLMAGFIAWGPIILGIVLGIVALQTFFGKDD
jgi:hypothetical protein